MDLRARGSGFLQALEYMAYQLKERRREDIMLAFGVPRIRLVGPPQLPSSVSFGCNGFRERIGRTVFLPSHGGAGAADGASGFG